VLQDRDVEIVRQTLQDIGFVALELPCLRAQFNRYGGRFRENEEQDARISVWPEANSDGVLTYQPLGSQTRRLSFGAGSRLALPSRWIAAQDGPGLLP
jgi:hypothetical protein